MLRFSAIVLGIVLSACATQNENYREGMLAVSQGRIEDGLARLEQASKEAPGNVEYRAAFARQREIAVNQLLSQAEAARMNNDFAQAEAIYRRVLGIDQGSERARQGLDEIALNRRHRSLIIDAEALM